VVSGSAHIYVSLVKQMLLMVIIGLRIVFKARLTSQTALLRLGKKMVASRLDKVEDDIGVNRRTSEPNGEDQGHVEHFGDDEHQ